MDTLRTMMRHLATSMSSGDVDAATALFQDEGRITVRDGEHALATLPAREALDAVMTAFSDVAYSPVLHHAGVSVGDDGVITVTHRSTFLGCPPSGRRVYLNVHLSAAQAGGGLLSDVTVGTSVASLRHQLAGGGDAFAVADGLTAEVRHRLWSAPPSVDDTRAGIGTGAEAEVGDVTPVRRVRQRKGVAVVIVAVVLLSLVAFGAVARPAAEPPQGRGAPADAAARIKVRCTASRAIRGPACVGVHVVRFSSSGIGSSHAHHVGSRPGDRHSYRSASGPAWPTGRPAFRHPLRLRFRTAESPGPERAQRSRPSDACCPSHGPGPGQRLHRQFGFSGSRPGAVTPACRRRGSGTAGRLGRHSGHPPAAGFRRRGPHRGQQH